ncbi:hypothetical protein HMPREF1548_03595 [Clostridium sp. KLE 1755]|nr:hypothetical protein HMPREF1548_03595 [Clostridium sp. KLE 1755]
MWRLIFDEIFFLRKSCTHTERGGKEVNAVRNKNKHRKEIR